MISVCNDVTSLVHIKDTMRLLSGKWTMQIVCFLSRNGKTRFMDIQRGVAGISPKILSKELHELQQRDIVFRTVNDPSLISVNYELTTKGKKLLVVILSLIGWGNANHKHLDGPFISL